MSSGSLLVSDQLIVEEDGFSPMISDLAEEKNETFSNEAEDYGSGSRQENKRSEEQEEEVLEQMVLSETTTWSEPRVAEEKEKTKNESDLQPRNDFQFEDVGGDGKKTWYFWK